MNEKDKEFFLSCDTPLDRVIHRPAARVLAALLKPTFVTPNAVTLASLVPAFLATWAFAGGEAAGAWAGLLGFYLWALLDHADGELARVKGITSEFGKKLDDTCDTIASTAMLVGLFAGLVKRSAWNAAVLWAAFVLTLAVHVIGNELVLRAKRKVRKKAVAEDKVGELALGQKILDHFTGREPFYILIGMVIAALTAGGTWTAWMAAALIALTAAMAAGTLGAGLGMARQARADSL